MPPLNILYNKPQLDMTIVEQMLSFFRRPLFYLPNNFHFISKFELAVDWANFLSAQAGLGPYCILQKRFWADSVRAVSVPTIQSRRFSPRRFSPETIQSRTNQSWTIQSKTIQSKMIQSRDNSVQDDSVQRQFSPRQFSPGTTQSKTIQSRVTRVVHILVNSVISIINNT